MNKTENLLVSVMEECSEIQKAASKALRFGLQNSNGLNPTNARQIILEFFDLMAVIQLLQDEGTLPTLTAEEQGELIAAKFRKVVSWQHVSREFGTLEEE